MVEMYYGALLNIASNLMKSVITGVFILQESSHTTDQSPFSGEPLVKHLPAHC